ncbi:RNA 2',3'-cyclic phosphodiesterase [Thermodesulfatator atlanticus]|uniref:RNA 2',3'-cyclic phosphodiesterase n=1 Tax=Thermodesulfatator atlanticus TaxID=501497 RepID=UPI0003B2F5DE|nr:RNA 2',3'-cyclic phosphodiesterase [Thermodesulfatator atlanticus]
MARLFLAINFPVKVKEKLKELQEDLASSRAQVRWVRPEGIHLTLKFFGEVPEEKIPAIAKVVEQVLKDLRLSELELGIKGMGAFPSLRSPRVVWVGLTGNLKALVLLQQKLEEAFEKIGFPREKRPFVPHVTLGRVKSYQRKEALFNKIKEHLEDEVIPTGEIKIGELILYESTLHPKGAIYTPLKRFPL